MVKLYGESKEKVQRSLLICDLPGFLFTELSRLPRADGHPTLRLQPKELYACSQ
jgi:hypothetical protein